LIAQYNQPAETRPMFKKIKKIPGLIPYLYFRWKAIGKLEKLWNSKRYIDLISFCCVLLAKNQADYTAFYYRGLAFEHLGLFAASVNDFKKANEYLVYKHKFFSKWYLTMILIHLSRVYKKLQDNEKAFEYANKAVDADVAGIEALKWRASLKEDIDDNLGALEDWNEALRRKPKNDAVLRMRNRMTYVVIERQREPNRGQS
jgi:tetratricopeptide (TPR) repeat protein